jgi:hypothetical protein
MRLAAGVLLAFAVALTAAAQDPQWPPPSGVEARMRELQAILSSRDATPEEREAAREELSSLLKSPAGQARPSRDEKKRPARAAIQPLPSMVKPAEGPIPTAPPVARIEVVPPAKAHVIPQTGAVAPDPGRFAVDPRTGAVLHEVPGGYIDPRTGQIVPR